MAHINLIKTSHAKLFLFRALSIYLVFYFLFISDFRGTYPFLQYINAPFKYLTLGLVRFIDSTILHWNFQGQLYFGDGRWTFIALLVFLVIAVLISLAWTLTDKGKTFPSLPKYIYVFSRYYLACLLLIYGTSKLYGNQFTLIPSILAQPVGNLDTHDLFWTFMGASKSYRIFAGLLETIAALLLLFRRTATVGALLAIMLLINILMLNIAYDTWVKIIAFHLILFAIITLIPDIKTLFQIFILRQPATLAVVPPVVEHQKYRWLQYTLKSVAFGVMIFTFGITELWNSDGEPPYRNIVGIYEIDRFHVQERSSVKTSMPWKKIVINQFDFLTVHYPNDSIARFNFQADTTSRSLEFQSRQGNTHLSRLTYTVSGNQWLFKGFLNNDSIEFTSKKIVMHDLNLLKGYGKVKWIYD